MKISFNVWNGCEKDVLEAIDYSGCKTKTDALNDIIVNYMNECFWGIMGRIFAMSNKIELCKSKQENMYDVYCNGEIITRIEKCLYDKVCGCTLVSVIENDEKRYFAKGGEA